MASTRPQAEPRFRKRLPCRLDQGTSASSALVLNVSRGGLSVQTSAQVRPGDRVRIELNPEAGTRPIPIGGQVVWKRVVAPHLRSVAPCGVGVRIQDAPAAYYEFVLGLGSGATAQAPERSVSEFRVRVKQRVGPRSRSLVVRGADTAEACRRALAASGTDWVVLEVEPR
jgi:Tfp pilus assembly protein PilZ